MVTFLPPLHHYSPVSLWTPSFQLFHGALSSPNRNLKYSSFRFPEVFIKAQKNTESRSWHIHSYKVLDCYKNNGPLQSFNPSYTSHRMRHPRRKWLVQGHTASQRHMQERNITLRFHSSAAPAVASSQILFYIFLPLIIPFEFSKLLDVHSLTEQI